MVELHLQDLSLIGQQTLLWQPCFISWGGQTQLYWGQEAQLERFWLAVASLQLSDSLLWVRVCSVFAWSVGCCTCLLLAWQERHIQWHKAGNVTPGRSSSIDFVSLDCRVPCWRRDCPGRCARPSARTRAQRHRARPAVPGLPAGPPGREDQGHGARPARKGPEGPGADRARCREGLQGMLPSRLPRLRRH